MSSGAAWTLSVIVAGFLLLLVGWLVRMVVLDLFDWYRDRQRDQDRRRRRRDREW